MCFALLSVKCFWGVLIMVKVLAAAGRMHLASTAACLTEFKTLPVGRQLDVWIYKMYAYDVTVARLMIPGGGLQKKLL
jgi:hypothetical protein